MLYPNFKSIERIDFEIRLSLFYKTLFREIRKRTQRTVTTVPHYRSTVNEQTLHKYPHNLVNF